jgi:hypothetical protein
MVLKPSEVSPMSSIVFSEIMDAAGVPPGVYNMVNGDGPSVGHQVRAGQVNLNYADWDAFAPFWGLQTIREWPGMR